MKSNRVFITGVGPVCSAGSGKNRFFENVNELKRNALQIPSLYEKNYKFNSKFYIPEPQVDLLKFGIENKTVRLMDSASKMAVHAALLAILDSGLKLSKADKYFSMDISSQIPVIMGIGISNLKSAFDAHEAVIFEGAKDITRDFGLCDEFPFITAFQVMANAPSAWISILFGLKSESFTINASCASGTIAIGNAYKKIKNGEYPIVLCGGVESLKDERGGTMRAFDVLLTLTRSHTGNPMPFSNQRSGFLFSDGGAAILVLESEKSAMKRGAYLYAEIIDYESNSDAYSIVQIDETGKQIESLIKTLKKDRQIDYVNTHGTATQLNDSIESKMLQKIFGDKEYQPLINSTKGILGHTIAASGALEAVYCALALNKKKVHGNDIVDPIENLNLVEKTMSADINTAMSLSYGFGGHNAGLLLKSID